jgi:RimJ/RimL family protein N-acetyltransferase
MGNELACSGQDWLPQPRKLPIIAEHGDQVGSLRQVGAADVADPELISRLTKWRSAYGEYFFSQFPATPGRTRNWLADLVKTPGTGLFIITCEPGRMVGQCQLTELRPGEFEVGNIIRGEEVQLKGFMYYALRCLLGWATVNLEAQAFELRVLSTNTRAIALYDRLGFVTAETAPLRRVVSDTEARWERMTSEDNSAPHGFWNRMRLLREAFVNRHSWCVPGGRA